MANAYVDELHTLNSQLAISEAGQRRLFYEEKVNAERDALSLAEVQLKQAQEKTGFCSRTRRRASSFKVWPTCGRRSLNWKSRSRPCVPMPPRTIPNCIVRSSSWRAYEPR